MVRRSSVQRPIMTNVTWSRFDQSAQQLVVGHTTKNHVINWDEATVITRESDRTIWWIMEAVKIRQESQGVMNRDKGAYQLNRIYDKLLLPLRTSSWQKSFLYWFYFMYCHCKLTMLCNYHYYHYYCSQFLCNLPSKVHSRKILTLWLATAVEPARPTDSCLASAGVAARPYLYVIKIN